MRITNSTVSDNIVRQIQKIGTQQADLQNQVSTGQRIFHPEDDPAAVGRTLNFQSEQRRIDQYLNNTSRALELSQASYSGLTSLKKVSNRALEIATLGGGVLNQSEREAYASEVDQLIQQSLELANSRFGSDYLFAGSKVDTQPFVRTPATGTITQITYAGDTASVPIPLSETTTVTPLTDGTTNQGIGSFLNQLVALRDALNANDTTAVGTVAQELVDSEDALVAAIAEHGGIQARIEAHKDQQTDRSTELEKLVSAEIDADLPTTIVKLTQSQTAYQAALQSAVNIMKVSLLDYIN